MKPALLASTLLCVSLSVLCAPALPRETREPGGHAPLTDLVEEQIAFIGAKVWRSHLSRDIYRIGPRLGRESGGSITYGEGWRVHVMSFAGSASTASWALEHREERGGMLLSPGTLGTTPTVTRRAHDYTFSRGSQQQRGGLDADSFSYRMSPDGARCLVRYRAGGKVYVNLDGQEFGPFSEVYYSLAFSSDSRHAAFVVKLEGEERLAVVIDGRLVSHVKAGYVPVSLAVGNDGKRWALTLEPLNARSRWLMLDGQLHGPYDWASVPEFSPDSRRCGWMFGKDGQGFVVLDGDTNGPYKGVGYLRFSADGRAYAYSARRGPGAAYIVVDGQEYGPFAQCRSLALSRDGTSWAAVVKREDAFFVLTDRGESGPYEDVVLMTGLVFGEKPQQLLFSFVRDSECYLNVQGREAGPFAGVEALGFLGKSGRAVAVVGRAEADGRRRENLWVEGALTADYDDIFGTTLRPEDDACTFVAGRAGQLYAVRVAQGSAGDILESGVSSDDSVSSGQTSLRPPVVVGRP